MRIPTKKKLVFKDATQKSATWPIFEKCPHLREKGRVADPNYRAYSE
jgi:hypothetical protein